MRKKMSLPGRMAAKGLVLLFLVVLVLGVMRLPQIYGRYSDERTLNRPEYAENEVSVYSYDYTSVTEKLQDIFYYEDKGIELTSMILPSAGDAEVSDEELKDILQGELDQMYLAGILLAQVDLEEYVCVHRQLRSIYPTNGDRLRGRISYWETVFESRDDVDDHVVILADTQYHKLYSLTLSGVMGDRMCFALQNFLIDGMNGGGKSGIQLAAELLNSLSAQLADYYGCTVPEGSEKIAEDVSTAEPGDGDYASKNGAAYGGSKYAGEGLSNVENLYEDIYYLEKMFYDIVDDKEVGMWYLTLPVSIDIGDGSLKYIPVTYDYQSDIFSVGIPFSTDYPGVD